ncbi:MAG: hypothetical protein R3C26_09290 [Calditrichia bacterium]
MWLKLPARKWHPRPVLLEEQDTEDDEMVFYSEPFAAAGGEWVAL